MTTARDILTAARALIAQPEAWTQHAYARANKDLVANRSGTPSVHFSSDRAVCWCSYGAVNRAGYGGGEFMPLMTSHRIAEINLAKQALARAMGGRPFDDELEADWKLCNIAKFNDAEGRTHAEVLAAFDRAIEEVSK